MVTGNRKTLIEETMENTIVVAMATYNGEKYIEKQLDSIWKQTRAS